MKKNTKTYILLTVVAFIWGTIGYKIIFSLSSEPQATNAVVVENFKPLAKKERDTFGIKADYRDPFLGTLAKTDKKAPKISRPKPDPQPQIDIQFTGFVKDKNTKKNIFFVTIEGQQYLMSINDEIQKVKLLRGSATAIRVRHQNKTRNIPLKQ